MNNKITTGCDRCDNFYKELAELNREKWALEANPPYDPQTNRDEWKRVRANTSLVRAKLDEHLIHAHQLAPPF